ncbi:MAG: hypothetical protein INF75_03395 [Roseomonas sp.]|nr:hypothetical protein [Roseomonas sp.]MCA3327489.1 hypothetical protein [Roseomonas sp.]MCA3348852.1 hypothetical protein [Roseomonas sp.]MCA3352651.1 hypothetical protein [Roseomonas sp.]MCA3371817.1 hypothetical protein [Roseomonas sp.]
MLFQPPDLGILKLFQVKSKAATGWKRKNVGSPQKQSIFALLALFKQPWVEIRLPEPVRKLFDAGSSFMSLWLLSDSRAALVCSRKIGRVLLEMAP